MAVLQSFVSGFGSEFPLFAHPPFFLKREAKSYVRMDYLPKKFYEFMAQSNIIVLYCLERTSLAPSHSIPVHFLACIFLFRDLNVFHDAFKVAFELLYCLILSY